MCPPPAIKPRLSLMMFFQYAIWGAWLPILYPFLLGHRHFTLEQTGYCLAAGAVGAILGPAIAGRLADKSFSTERLLAISHLLGAGLVWKLGQTEDFRSFFVLSAIYGLVYAPTLALTNSLALANLENRDRDFGPVRLWGTIGWIAAGIMVGQILLRSHTPTGVSPEALAAAQNAELVWPNCGVLVVCGATRVASSVSRPLATYSEWCSALDHYAFLATRSYRPTSPTAI